MSCLMVVGDNLIPVQGPARRPCLDQVSVKLPNEFNQLGKLRPARSLSLAKSVMPLQERASGEMAEWLKGHAWKPWVRETVPWVRIPVSPPAKHSNALILFCNIRRWYRRPPNQSPSAAQIHR